MRQLAAMFVNDLRMNVKSFTAAYMLVVPLIILFVLRFFLPSVQDTSATVAVVAEGSNAIESELIAELETVFAVEQYDSVEQMEERLRGTGSVEGLYRDPESKKYVSVLERSFEGNRRFSVSSAVVRQYVMERDYENPRRLVRVESSIPSALQDRTQNSPVATTGGAIFVVFITIISAFIIGLGVVNDKEYGTDRALRVTPLTRTEYYVAKSLFPLLILFVYAAVTLAVLGIVGVNVLQLYVAVVASGIITLVLGLFVGAMAKNETEAMGVGKTLSTVIMLAILGGVLLPDNWQWVVYWVPVYWLYNLAESIFTLTADWIEVLWKTGIILGTTGLYFLIAGKRIARGLS